MNVVEKREVSSVVRKTGKGMIPRSTVCGKRERVRVEDERIKKD